MENYLEKRNTAIDLLRALTMALMLMVNDFWSVNGIPHWMGHAEWGEDALGFSDVVFPTFLFCVGLSIPYAITAMRRKGKSDGDVVRHILERSFALILMGAFICNYESGIDPSIGYDQSVYCIVMTIGFFLLYNYYKKTGLAIRICKWVGWALLLFLLITSRSPEGKSFSPSWWGILGLIGWAYLFCALVFALATRKSTNIVVWVLLFLVCLGCSQTAESSIFHGKNILSMPQAGILYQVLDILHVGNASSHLLVMSGVLFSAYYLQLADKWATQQKAIRSLLLALVCGAIGLLSHQWFTTSKLIGTLPWIFYSLAIAIAVYMLFDQLALHGKAHWFKFLKTAGTATLTCYLVPYALYPIISMTIGWDWSYAVPEPFGIIKCVAFSAVCITIAWLLGKVSIKLKI